MPKVAFYLAGILLLMSIAFSHEIAQEEFKKVLPINPLNVIYVAGGIAILVLILSILFHKNFAETHKKFAFSLVAIPVVFASLYLVASTIYLNINSVSQGPVHWHADYQVWVCNERLDLADPKGLVNRIGSPTLHGHDDDRIHIEGTVMSFEDVNLKSFFRKIGGELEKGHLIYPTNDKIVNVKNGDSCPDGSIGNLKVYVNGERVYNFEDYVIYPSALVPPGDCVIIIFDGSDSNKTNLICESWEAVGWSYENFKRREVKIGDKVWR